MKRVDYIICFELTFINQTQTFILKVRLSIIKEEMRILPGEEK